MPPPALIAVTGAAGFVGAAFCRRAIAEGRPVLRFVREPAPAAADVPIAVDLAQASIDDLARRLDGVAAVVHLAGRAHVIDETVPDADADAAYRAANAGATERLARAAVVAGVPRFVFASTVKVNGEATACGRPFRPADAPAPQDAYARSKLAAEEALARVAAGASMRVVVLRLPLVYGPGARGNFRRLVDAVAKRRWLPVAAIDNRRSLLGLPNLLDAIDAALDTSRDSAGVHFVADADSVSTPALVRAIATALGTRPRMLAVPTGSLRLAGRLAGQRNAIARLTQSLEVDTSSFVRATGWRPRRFAIDAAAVADRAPGDPGAGHIIGRYA